MNLKIFPTHPANDWLLAVLVRQLVDWLAPVGTRWQTCLALVGCTVGGLIAAYAMAADLPIASWLIVVGVLAALLGIVAITFGTLAVGPHAIRNAGTRYRRVSKANVRSLLVFATYGFATCSVACLMAAGLPILLGPQPAIVVVAGVLASLAIASLGSALSVRPHDSIACFIGTSEPHPAVGFLEPIRRVLSAAARREACLPADGSAHGYGNVFALSVILERGAKDDSAGRFKNLDRLPGLAFLPETRRRAGALVRVAVLPFVALLLFALIGFPGADALGRLSRPFFPDPLELFELRLQAPEMPANEAHSSSYSDGGPSESSAGGFGGQEPNTDAAGTGHGDGGTSPSPSQGNGRHSTGGQDGGEQGDAGTGGDETGNRPGGSQSTRRGAGGSLGGQGQTAGTSATTEQDGATASGQSDHDGDSASTGSSGDGAQPDAGQYGSHDGQSPGTTGANGVGSSSNASEHGVQRADASRTGRNLSDGGNSGSAGSDINSAPGAQSNVTSKPDTTKTEADGSGGSTAAERNANEGDSADATHRQGKAKGSASREPGVAAGGADDSASDGEASDASSDRRSAEASASSNDGSRPNLSAPAPEIEFGEGNEGGIVELEPRGEGRTAGTGTESAPPDPSDLPNLRDVAPPQPSPSDGRTVMVDGQALRFAGEGAPAEVIELTPSFPAPSSEDPPARDHHPRQVLPSWIDRLIKQ